MILLKLVMWVLCSVLLLNSIITKQKLKSSHNIISFPVSKGIRVNYIYAFESVAVPLYQCSELCKNRKVCKSANFISEEKKCFLNAVIISNHTAVGDLTAVYIEKDNLNYVSVFFSLLCVLFFFYYYLGEGRGECQCIACLLLSYLISSQGSSIFTL